MAPPARRLSAQAARTRRVIATADEVIVVAGRQQAYNLVAQLFLGVGARVVVEAAGAPGASAVYAGRGAEPLPVAPDERGFDLDSLPAGRVALVHVAPNCQAATDSAMPQKRRERLVAWAAERGTPLLEDDCDGDFRYQGGPATPLKAIDPAGLVLHLGTFQNTLGAGMPLAYLVVPPRLLDRALAARRLLDDGGSWTSQMVLAEFIRGGAYDRHVHRLRNTFLKRRDCLIDALRRHFGDVRLGATGAGRHLLWFLPAHWPAPAAIERQLRQAGIEVGPWDAATAVPRWPHALVLAYAHLTEAEIRDGVARLAGVLGELSVFASAI